MKARMLVAATLLALAQGALAQDLDAVKAKFAARFPAVAPIEAIAKSPLPGLFEIFAQGRIVYADAEVKYILDGSLIDLEARTNLTQERLGKLTAVAFNDLPLEHAVKIVRGKGTRKIAVFEDPNCGYCKRFEQELAKVDDITVYVFLYPILAAESREKSEAVWCAPDRAKAWVDLMTKNITPAAKKCSTPIDKIIAFGRQKAINGTPAIIFADGSRVPGMLTADKIEERLKLAANGGGKK